MPTTEEILENIYAKIDSVVRPSGDVSIGFFNQASLDSLIYGVAKGSADGSYTGLLKYYENKKKNQDKQTATQLEKYIKDGIVRVYNGNKKIAGETAKELKNGFKEAASKFGKVGEIYSKIDDTLKIFKSGSSFTKNLFLASKAFEAGTGILKKAFQASMTYMDAAKDLSDAGLMIGSSSNMLYRTVEGAYERFSDGTADFNSIITHSANLAGIRLEDFGEKLKNNSTFLTRMYAMGVEGTAEIGHLYATVAKRAGDMSQRNADAVVKQWSSAIMPFYTSEEIMANKLNGSFDNLVETMNYFMKATGKSAENLIKENELKEKTAALEKLTAENPVIASLMKSAGFSEEMIMHALTGRITGELNLQLMNSPIFSRGLQNVRQIIAQHRNDGYLNTEEGRKLFANTLLSAVNNAEPEKKRAMENNGYWTYNSYMSYEEIRRRQGVEFLNPDFMNLNANVLGQNSSQTKMVESANELNRNRNKVLNDILDLLSPSATNIATITTIMSEITGIGHAVAPNSLTSPIMNTLIGGGALLGGGALATWGTIYGLKTMMGGGLFKSGLAASGAGAQTAGGIPLSSALIRSATAKTALATTGRALGAGASAAIAGYNLYDEWETSSKTKKASQLASLLLGIGGLIAAPFSGGLSLALTAGSIGTGALSGFLPDKAGSQLEQSARRGSTEGQPYYFNSPEIVNKLNQIQTVCQSLYGVACMNKQMNTFARMDAVSASYK